MEVLIAKYLEECRPNAVLKVQNMIIVIFDFDDVDCKQ